MPDQLQLYRAERPLLSEATHAVYDAYRQYHPRAKVDVIGVNCIRQRLAEGHSIDDLVEAVHGLHRSPWHCGQNPGGRKYQKLELILRSSDHVLQFIEIGHNEASGRDKSAVATAARWASRGGNGNG